jgi:hypothetical protein
MKAPHYPAIAFNGGFYLPNIMDRYEGPLTALTMALHRGLYLDIIMDRYEGPLTDLTNSLALRPHLSLYNGPL